MPATLARYAVMFYVSSLVRYWPSNLDPRVRSEQAWLLDAFTNQAAVPIIRSLFNWVSETEVVFMAPATMRI